MDQSQMPLWTHLQKHAGGKPISFHVPGHKMGNILPKDLHPNLRALLGLDVTEIGGMDDLHDPHGVIKDAQELAADFFGVKETFFLVGGSTVGNISMLFATCMPGDRVIVQRNSHKSIFHALELRGVEPILINPVYDEGLGRYTSPSFLVLKEALQTYANIKAVFLTYPDYFGGAFDIEKMITYIHTYDIPVLVDEAHGVHFSLGEPFPNSAVEYGADMLVQSAHKMAPAMTMASFLHINSTRISKQIVQYYLNMFESSSPSYVLMASLDMARYFLAQLTKRDISVISKSVQGVRDILAQSDLWKVEQEGKSRDPLKITLNMKEGISGYDVCDLFEAEGIFPELATGRHLLFVHGLAPFKENERLRYGQERIAKQLKKAGIHATIDIRKLYDKDIQTLAYSYQDMLGKKTKMIELDLAAGHVAGENVLPYPPGIPIILRGEYITNQHVDILDKLSAQGAHFQSSYQPREIKVFI